VENAIKHGLEPRTSGGTVWIRARRDGDSVAVTVADDGNGLGSSATAGSGIGLRNVRERLPLRPGGKAGLAVVANFPAAVAATSAVAALPSTTAPAEVRGHEQRPHLDRDRGRGRSAAARRAGRRPARRLARARGAGR